jgi:radical SAM superfamily enzyme YgiQ (UPF0313 family)
MTTTVELFQPRLLSWESILAGGEFDVLLCQPTLTLRIPFEEQVAEVRAYFESQTAGGDRLLGDDPYEPNNALLQLAADLRKAGVKVRILDFHMLDIWHRRSKKRPLLEGDILRILRRFHYRVLGISVMCVAEKGASDLARMSKELNPQSLVIVGGLLPSALPDEFNAKHPHVDEVVVGDGAERIIQLLGENSANLRLNEWPSASRAFDLLPTEMPLVPRVTTQFGCPYRCAFCSPIQMSHRQISPEISIAVQTKRIVGEITALREIYATDFFVMGNLSYLANSALDESVCRSLKHLEVKSRYWCQMRPDHVTPERSALLKDSGCVQVAIGIENTNSASLRKSRKTYRLASAGAHLNYEAVLRTLRDAGLSTYGYFMIGFPGDTESDVLEGISYMDWLFAGNLLDAAHISVPVAYPGTPWYSRPSDFGIKIRHHDFSNYWMNCDPLGYSVPMMDTSSLSAEKIYELWLLALRVIAQRHQRQSKHRPTRSFNFIKSALT